MRKYVMASFKKCFRKNYFWKADDTRKCIANVTPAYSAPGYNRMQKAIRQENDAMGIFNKAIM